VKLGDGIISGFWDLEEAFRNDPYIVSFKRGNFDFSLILVHTRWTDDDEGTRAGEVAMVAEQILWMKDFLVERDIIVAGDFNYAGTDEAMVGMAQTADLIQLDPNHKSTFKTDYTGYANSYDHIYVLDGQTSEYIDGSCQTLDATKLIYGDNSVSNMRTSKRELSDHLPVWAAFKVDQPDTD
jgi:endonuclease/exonuclease/phosphatase family metal-dependent hydrolase